MKRNLHVALLLLIYFTKWPLFIGIPILYLITPYESNLMMNSFWFLAFVAIFWDVVRKFTNA